MSHNLEKEVENVLCVELILFECSVGSWTDGFSGDFFAWLEDESSVGSVLLID